MGADLTLPERLRVCAALNPEGFSIHLDRENALWLVRIMEREELMIRGRDALISLRADHAAREKRRDRILRRSLWDLFSVSVSALTLSWCISGWLQ